MVIRRAINNQRIEYAGAIGGDLCMHSGIDLYDPAGVFFCCDSGFYRSCLVSCHYPIQAYRRVSGGKLVFEKPIYEAYVPMSVPCNKCTGCCLDYENQWAIRALHEAQIFEQRGLESWFISPTFEDKYLRTDMSLDHSEWQLFRRRVAKEFPLFRFLMCGEYGPRTNRPHFHAVGFGLNLPDAVYAYGEKGEEQYESDTLNRLWGRGFIHAAPVTIKSARYPARYLLKDRQKRWQDDYEYYDPARCQVYKRKPPYALASRNPRGLGFDWFQKYWRDVYPSDQVVFDGGIYRPPKYYDKLLQEFHPGVYAEVKRCREDYALSDAGKASRRPSKVAGKAKYVRAKLDLGREGRAV